MKKQLTATVKAQGKAALIYARAHKRHIFNKATDFGTWIIKLIIIVGVSFIIITPIFGIISKTFMSKDDAYNPLVYMIPENFTLYNIQTAFESMDFGKSLIFTGGVCIMVMLIQAFICAVIGYGFARFRFPGKGLLFGLVVLTIIIPMETMMVPMFTQFRYFDPLGLVKMITGEQSGINLMNSIMPVLLMSLTGMGLRSGLYIFIYRQFFRGLPKEIEEAATIDGCGTFRTFIQIMLPNAMSSIIIVMLFAFVWQYNDTFMSGLFMESMDMIPKKLNSLNSVLTQVLNIRDVKQVQLIINAGVFLTITPLVVIYLFMQRFFMEGIERSGIVG